MKKKLSKAAPYKSFSRLHPRLMSRLKRHFGAIRRTEQIGRHTWMTSLKQQTIVVKKMTPSYSPSSFREYYARVQAAGISCPNLLSCFEWEHSCLACYEHCKGSIPVPGEHGWDKVWQTALEWLSKFLTVENASPSWNLEKLWLKQLLKICSSHPQGNKLLRWLRENPIEGKWCAAHGDFAPQNWLWSGSNLILVDWEEPGYSRAGFDAGWLLALNRVGAGPRKEQNVLFKELQGTGFHDHNLRWFEGLGLVRLLYRTLTEKFPAKQKALMKFRVEIAMEDFMAD